jgi:hypothetical protein
MYMTKDEKRTSVSGNCDNSLLNRVLNFARRANFENPVHRYQVKNMWATYSVIGNCPVGSSVYQESARRLWNVIQEKHDILGCKEISSFDHFKVWIGELCKN